MSYPFGYGLSYTTFKYDNPVVNVKGDKVTVSVTITNVGKSAGKEIVQVYVSAPRGSIEKPAQELKAFAKTQELKVGDSETLSMNIDVADLASFHEKQSAWVVDAGIYTFRVGASSRDIRGTATARITAMKQKVSNSLKPVQKINILHQ